MRVINIKTSSKRGQAYTNTGQSRVPLWRIGVGVNLRLRGMCKYPLPVHLVNRLDGGTVPCE
jgi:hypothetical protein